MRTPEEHAREALDDQVRRHADLAEALLYALSDYAISLRHADEAAVLAVIREAFARAREGQAAPAKYGPGSASHVPYVVEEVRPGAWRASLRGRVQATGPSKVEALAYLRGRCAATVAMLDDEAPAAAQPAMRCSECDGPAVHIDVGANDYPCCGLDCCNADEDGWGSKPLPDADAADATGWCERHRVEATPTPEPTTHRCGVSVRAGESCPRCRPEENGREATQEQPRPSFDVRCPHPARGGRHEVYVGRGREFCRACGAERAAGVRVQPQMSSQTVCTCDSFGGGYPDGAHLACCPAHDAATCPRCQKAHARDRGRPCPRDPRCAKAAGHRGACWRARTPAADTEAETP